MHEFILTVPQLGFVMSVLAQTSSADDKDLQVLGDIYAQMPTADPVQPQRVEFSTAGVERLLALVEATKEGKGGIFASFALGYLDLVDKLRGALPENTE